ncbi:MAG: BON domain-containing protein [Legionella sp.]|nr:BON domain-containing protein [Legionella sp.]
MNYKHKIGSLCLMGLFLTGCVAVVVAGAAVAGLVYDKRSVDTLSADARLFHVIHTKIVTNPRFKNSRILVTSFNRVILLLGQASIPLKEEAYHIARTTPGVSRVYNEITPASPTTLTQRSQDTWITSQVRAAMLTRQDLGSGSIRIVTERGIVYLMGMVTPSQSNLAVDVARRVDGVNKVIKIFQYVH